MVRTTLTGLAVLLAVGGCKGESKYEKLAREAKSARADAGPRVVAAPPEATLLATTQDGPRQILVDEANVYWLCDGSRGEGAPGLFKAPKGGGDAVALVKSDGISVFAQDASALYFLLPRAGKVMKLEKAGGAPVELATTDGLMRVLAQDDTSLFWGEDQGLFTVPKAGGKAQLVQKGASLPDFLVADAAALYWYSSLSGKVFRSAKKGGAPALLLADDQHTLTSLFTDGTDLYFSYGAEKSAEVFRLPKAGGKPAQVVGGQDPAGDFASDGSFLYWATEDGIFKVSRSGGAATAVVTKGDRIRNLAVDGSSVYWTDRGGRVSKMPR